MGSKMNGALVGHLIGPPNTKPTEEHAPVARPEKHGQFVLQFDEALNSGDLQAARSLVASEEERLQTDLQGQQADARAQIAAAKAKIAMKTEDSAAAHAILLAAIETDPHNRPLRVLMSEVMLATGRATDVRPVLKHVGKSATEHFRTDGGGAVIGGGSTKDRT